MRVLSPAQGYALWAPRYDETAITVLEAAAVGAHGPPLDGRRLLDAGCGNGRRLANARAAGASVAVGVDLVPEMLAQARDEPLLAAADVRALPVASGAFDVVWCRLVLGHVADLDAAYAELGRCCAPGGILVVTDFHPAAVEAGHRRTFRDATGAVHELENHVYRVDTHRASAARAGLTLRERHDCTVNETVRGFYERAGRLDMYERQLGQPIVLALVFARAG